MALELDSNQNAIMVALETALEEAFMNGTTFEAAEVVAPALGYKAAQYQVLGDLPIDVRALVKAYFKASSAAFLKALKPPVWTDIPYNTGFSWAAYGGRPVLAYHKDLTGKIHLRGAAAGGVEFTTAATLPEEARPSEIVTVPVYARIGSSQVLTAVEIGTNGDVVVPPTPVGTYSFLSLDGISYY